MSAINLPAPGLEAVPRKPGVASCVTSIGRCRQTAPSI